MEELTPQELKAVKYYMLGYSKAAALRKAGYSESTATSHASEFYRREKIADEVRRRRNRLSSKNDVTLDRIIGALLRIAESDVGDVLRFDENDKLQYIHDPDATYGLSGLKIRTYKTGRGSDAQPVTEVTVTQKDQIKAWELIAKLTGLMEDKVKVSLDQDIMDRLRRGQEQVNGSDSGPEAS